MEKEEEKTAKQRAGIMSARNRNGLCPYCGNFKHDGECVPTYENTDNTPGGHYIYDRISKEYIIRYRKKNGLCERCGNPPHDGECEEVFEKQKGKRTLPDDSAEKRRIGGIIA